MSNPRLLLNLHTAIMLCVISQNYTVKGGLCQGIALTGSEFLLTENISGFNKSIKLIKRIFIDILKAPEFNNISLLHTLCREKILTPHQQNSLSALLKILNVKIQNLSKHNQDLLRDFFKKIASYHGHYHELETRASLVGSSELKAIGFIHKFENLNECPSNLNESTTFLAELRKTLQQVDRPAAIYLWGRRNSPPSKSVEIKTTVNNITITLKPLDHILTDVPKHAIVIGYNPKIDKWIFLDSNYLPAVYVQCNKKLAEKIYHSFAANDDTPSYPINIHVSGNNKNYFVNVLEQWQQNQEIQSLRNEVNNLDTPTNTHYYLAITKLKKLVAEAPNKEKILEALVPFKKLEDQAEQIEFNSSNAWQLLRDRFEIHCAYGAYAKAKNHDERQEIVKSAINRIKERAKSYLKKWSGDQVNQNSLFATAKWAATKVSESLCWRVRPKR